MVVLLGLEVVAGAALVGALRTTSLADRLRAYAYGGGPADDDSSEAAAADASDGAPVPASPVPLRVRSLRLPRLLAVPAVADEGPEAVVLGGSAMLEQVANAIPRRFGDIGGDWHLLFSTAQQGTSLAHMLRCARDAGPCLLVLRDRCDCVHMLMLMLTT